jgi:hypothetical protein
MNTKRKEVQTLERNESSKEQMSLSPRFYSNNNER